MTMKEIENLSGMSRANIRFYEGIPTATETIPKKTWTRFGRSGFCARSTSAWRTSDP